MAAAPEAIDSGKMIVLISSDGKRFELPEAVARLSQTVLDKMNQDDNYIDNGIPLPNVAADVLAKVIEHCTKHAAINSEADGSSSSTDAADAAKASKEEDLRNFDDKFIEVDNAMLVGLMMAAKDMGVENLVHLGCQRVADMINGKTVEQLRQMLGIADNLQEEMHEQDNTWAFK